MAYVLKSFFCVGIYNPEYHDSWPYFHGFDDGIFLSKNHRKCKFNSAIKFDNPNDVREFFSKWSGAKKYKLHVFPFQTHAEVPDPVFPPNHPRSILKLIKQNEYCYVHSTALSWFLGDDYQLWSKQTIARHRKILLKYGIDISQKPTEILQPLPSQHDDEWRLAKPNLQVV